MKRDMDLIRKLLLEIEASSPQEGWSLEVMEPTEETARIAGHLRLLRDAGWIHVVDSRSYVGGREVWLLVRLTWHGHEFLDTIRSENVWAETKRRVTSTVGTVSISVLTEVAKHVAKGLLGVP